MATSVNVLRLKCNELESNLAKQIDVVNQLKIKLKHVEQLSTTIHQTKFNATTVIKRDTIICKDTIYRFHWHNTWNQLSGVIFGDSLTCTLSVRDTLHQIVHRIPRRFLFIRFGTKYLKQEIVTSNPNCNIVWSKYIKVEKSRYKNICLP